MKRRDFLKKAGIGAAVVVIPMTVAARLQGDVIYPTADKSISLEEMRRTVAELKRLQLEQAYRAAYPPVFYEDVPMTGNAYAGNGVINSAKYKRWLAP